MYNQLAEDNKTKFNEMYSSVQWFTALDSLIYSAIDVLIQRTTFVEEHISHLILYQLTYKKRGVSTQLNWLEAIDKMVQFIHSPSIDNYKDLSLDRGFSIQIIKDFSDILAEYNKKVVLNFRHSFTTDLFDYHYLARAKSDDLYGTIQHVSYCLTKILELKKELLSYYMLYLEKVSNYDSTQSKFVTDREEIKQNYYLAFNKAVDHFNISKGAFKSYLDIWITKYRNHHTNYYGTAFIVPSGSGVHSMSCELDLNVIGEDENYSCSNSIDIVNNEKQFNFFIKLARIVDPKGYAIKFLDLN